MSRAKRALKLVPVADPSSPRMASASTSSHVHVLISQDLPAMLRSQRAFMVLVRLLPAMR